MIINLAVMIHRDPVGTSRGAVTDADVKICDEIYESKK